MTAGNLSIALIAAITLAGCCHLGGDDTDTYDPCEDKEEGETCQLCAPDDTDCGETQQIKVCNADGECGGVAAAHDH